MSDEWRYEVKYGPEGEDYYAWVYCGKEMIATMKTYNAVDIVKAMNSQSDGSKVIVIGEETIAALREGKEVSLTNGIFLIPASNLAPALTNTSGDDDAPVADEIKTPKEEVARLEDELNDALQNPWPEWAEKIIKLVRSYSGYDGYDDATDGVDVVGEVEEALSELYSEAERLRAARPQSAAVRDDQVEAACAKHWSGTWNSKFHSEDTKKRMRKMMRLTLEAALHSTQEG